MRSSAAPAPDLFQHAAEAEKRKRVGMKLALVAQDEKMPEWSELAYRAIVAIAKRQETVHVDDVLREFDAEPAHPNSWGSVWARALRDDVLVHSGRVRPCTAHARKNKHSYPIYQSLIFERE